MFYKFLSKFVILALLVFQTINVSQARSVDKSSAVKHDDILGTWRIQKQNDGRPGTVGVMKKDKNGNYFMVVTQYRDGHGKIITNTARCTKTCPKGFKNKPIKGMAVVWNLKPDAKRPGRYTSGYGFDPRREILFQGTAKLSRNKNALHFTVSPLGAKFVKKKMVLLRGKD